VEPLVQAAEQFVRDARLAKASGGLTLPFAQRVALAFDAGMHELLPACKPPVAHQTAAALTVGISMSAAATVTSSINLALPPMRVSSQRTVVKRPRGLAVPSDGQIVFLVLVWLYALVLPWMARRLSAECHDMLNDGYAAVAIALAITWRALDKHK
jgi:hypothetical protein